MDSKKVLYSGVKPSGDLTLGNYLGAIKSWVKLQDNYDCYFSIVDLHAITVRQNPKDLRQRTMELMAYYIASGINIEKSTIYIQSHVSNHTECAWLLSCNSYMGELNRMTQFKEKSENQTNSVGAGLFIYPVLMASDILLFQTEVVPVGEDQKQHIELTRDLATRFNNAYSETFKIPEPIINKVGARIMDLQDPTKKMSKSSDNDNGYILLKDSEQDIRRKIGRAVTDSVGIVQYNDEQLGIKNLMTIYNLISNLSFDEIEQKYKGENYAKFKEDLANIVVDELNPIRKKAEEILNDKEYLKELAKKGADKATYTSNKTLNKIKRKIGFVL